MSDDPPVDPLPPPDAPAPADDPAASVTGGANCPYCLTTVVPTDAAETCPSCGAVHHGECWQENGGCAVYGCTQVPVVESRRAIEVPLSYWGQENKPCPSCGQQILAAAMRCRHCGATFSSARPQETTEFRSRAALETRLPEARGRVVLLFVLSVVPFTAPIGAIWGLVWRERHREEIAALPPLHAAISKIGLYTAIALTAGYIVMTSLYVLVRAL